MSHIVAIDGPDEDGFIWLTHKSKGRLGRVNLGHYLKAPASDIVTALGLRPEPTRMSFVHLIGGHKGEKGG
jgi:hypothetical protein